MIQATKFTKEMIIPISQNHWITNLDSKKIKTLKNHCQNIPWKYQKNPKKLIMINIHQNLKIIAILSIKSKKNRKPIDPITIKLLP
jgi:hypothetical protein